AVMLGDEMIDEASRKMALVVAADEPGSRTRRRGAARRSRSHRAGRPGRRSSAAVPGRRSSVAMIV
ncbi:hypothetical protein ACWDTT_38150, partial [Streptosporangium sandarakinum]